MTKIILLAGLLFPYVLLAQCPTDIQLTLGSKSSSTGSCPGDTLKISPAAGITALDWYRDGSIIRHVTASLNPTILTVAGGNGYGSASNQIGTVWGISVDNNGNVYVVDFQNNRVQKWAPGAASGVTVAGGNGQGPAANQFNGPTGLFLDAYGNLYVTDCYNYRVQKWAPGATSGVTVAGGNGPGSAANQLNQPNGLFVDANGNIFIADDGNHRIQEWMPGAAGGITAAGGNGQGSAANQLYNPPDVFVDPNGNIYVADLVNNRVQKWAPGATSGVTVAGGNGAGYALNQLNQPAGLFVDAGGNLYIVDQNNNRVVEWAPGATSGVVVAGGGAPGPGMNQFNAPESLWVDGAGDIYVGDYGNNRVQEWLPPHPVDSIYIADQPGSYTASLVTGMGCHLSYGPITIDATHNPAIAIGASTTNICSGTNVLFTASPTDGGTQPGYQWQVNGVVQTGSGGSWSDAGLANGDIVSCLMTSSATCPSMRIATSNPIAMAVTPSVTASVSIDASATTVCAGQPATFTANPVNGGSSPTLQWQVNGRDAGVSGLSFISSSLSDGDKIDVQLSGNAACSSPSTALSNVVIVAVVPDPGATVEIATPTTTVCSASPVPFTAKGTNTGNSPTYIWQVNGVAAGGNSAQFIDVTPHEGGVITCQLKSNAVCPAALSNAIPLTVNLSPTVSLEPEIDINLGQTVRLNPTITGDVNTYSWTPATALSAIGIPDPVARPDSTTTYTLTVTTTEDCTAAGKVTLKVFTALRIPGAFTPNDDGRNDRFYVLGGPVGSLVKNLSLFNRWGQCVFQVHDVLPGNAAYGWDGYVNGSAAPAGVYVYLVEMQFGDGKKQVLKGTLMLIR